MTTTGLNSDTHGHDTVSLVLPNEPPATTANLGSSNSTTTLVLLDRLRSGGTHEDWDALDRRYRRVIHGVALRVGLSTEDAEDVAQQTLLEFFSGWRRGAYDPSRSRLRTWLISIVRHRCIDLMRRADHRVPLRSLNAIDGGGHAVEEMDDPRLESAWDAEWRRTVLVEAVERLRASPKANPKSLETFERCAIRGVPPAAVAEELGVGVDEIYRLKSDALQRLRTIIAAIEASWDA